MKSILFLVTVFSLGLASADVEVNHLEPLAHVEIGQEAFQARVANYGYYNFGVVPVNSHNRGTVYVRNNSHVPLRFDYSNTWGMDFSSSHSCFGVLYPGHSCFVYVTYWPNRVGFHTGEVNLRFSSQVPPYMIQHMTIRLQGQAVRR